MNCVKLETDGGHNCPLQSRGRVGEREGGGRDGERSVMGVDEIATLHRPTTRRRSRLTGAFPLRLVHPKWTERADGQILIASIAAYCRSREPSQGASLSGMSLISGPHSLPIIPPSSAVGHWTFAFQCDGCVAADSSLGFPLFPISRHLRDDHSARRRRRRPSRRPRFRRPPRHIPGQQPAPGHGRRQRHSPSRRAGRCC